MPDELFVIGTRDGYEGEVGVMVGMLQNARQYLLSAVRGLDTASLDARPAPAVNTIGSILAHLAAAEFMIGLRVFENRRATDEEKRIHGPAFQYQDSSRPAGRTMGSYLDALRASREATLRGMRGRPQGWLQEPRVFAGRPANVHYFLLHYLQDEARHTGQIILIRKHLLPGSDPEFDPYVFPADMEAAHGS